MPACVVHAGKVSFHPQYWSTVSDEAKDLIQRMLCLDSVRLAAPALSTASRLRVRIASIKALASRCSVAGMRTLVALDGAMCL